MSEKKTFLHDLRKLMERVPDGLSENQLEWALSETALVFECRLTCLRARRQQKTHVPGGGTH
jgi:hypothetical protein